MESLAPFLPWIIGAGLVLLAYLLRKLFKKMNERENRLGKASQSRDDRAEKNRKMMEERDREFRERELREQHAREEKVKKILKTEPSLAEQLKKMGGISQDMSITEILNNPDLVRDLARKIPPASLDILSIAASQKDIEFDLTKQSERSPVLYPTSDVEPVLITNINQMTSILPEELMYEDESFYRKLANQELIGMQAYETSVERKLLYILYDASPSMDGQMMNGLPRHIWARGVILNLLMRAVRGEAKYFLRSFASYPMDLVSVTNQKEAEKLINYLSKETPRAGGTSIMKALSRAVEDIKTLGGEISQADILLISDGEDDEMKNIDRVKNILGRDIKLHVALIGSSAPHLEKVSASYRTFN